MAKSNFVVRGGADFSGIYKGFNTIQKRMNTFQTTINKTLKGIGITLGGLAIGKLIKDSTSAAMGVESAIDNISRNMGNATKTFQDWIATQSKGLGMAKAEAYSYGSTFSNLLGSFLSGTEETAQETQNLMKAAAVIASKTGRTYEDVSDRIRSGLLGSTEAIEDLGIYVQVSMLESTEAFKRFAGNKSWNQLSYQTQQQIRLAAILEQTYKRYGDTLADTTQTRQAQFLASLNNIKLSLGQAFLPIYNAVLPALTAMADAINRVVGVFAQFTQALFGKAVTSQTKATQHQAAAMTQLGDATEKAGKQAKGALMGFDEIHQLAENEGSTASVSAPMVGVSAVTLEEISGTEDLSKMQELAEKIKIAFEPAAIAFERLKTAAEPVITNVGQGLRWFYDNVLIPFGTWVISEAVPAFFNTLGGALQFVNSVIEFFKPYGQWLWDNFLVPIANWTGGVIISVLNNLADVFTKISDWIKTHRGTIETFAIILGSLAAAWGLVTIATNIGTIAMTAWAFIVGLATTITSAFSAVVAFLTSPITLVVLAIGAVIAIVVLLIKHWDDVKAAAISCWEWIKQTWSVVAEWFNTNIIQPIGQFFSNMWAGIKDFASNAWTGIKNVWMAVSNWFNVNIISPVRTFFSDMFAAIGNFGKEAWDTIKTVFLNVATWFQTNVTEPIGNFFKGAINVVIDALNWMIRGLNKISFKIPDWVPGLGGQTWGINIAEIPRLAKGGITNGPTLAMVGDNPGGREVISPLNDLMDMIASAVGSAVMAAMQFNANSKANGDIILNIDGRTFAHIIKPYLDQEAMRIGDDILLNPI